ncbi:MAG: UDP-2,3-diacylglucosamine hydrolase [Pseudomonadota bacterium]
MRPHESLPNPELSATDRLLLVSDLHLSDETPDLTQLALDWIQDQSSRLELSALWVLGDLFDAWVGDDQLSLSPCAQQVAEGLHRLSGSGIQVALMQGNRDFLLGASFAEACGASLLPEVWTGALPDGQRAVVCHGDGLCLDDRDYMQFREQTRDAQWQHRFLAMPLDQRLQTARQIRAKSESEKASKSMEIMDIRASAAIQLLERHKSALLIHGHTHRPGSSPLGPYHTRWVLTDWHWAPSLDARRGGGLLLTQAGPQSLGLSAR